LNLVISVATPAGFYGLSWPEFDPPIYVLPNDTLFTWVVGSEAAAAAASYPDDPSPVELLKPKFLEWVAHTPFPPKRLDGKPCGF
jgi:hypothetical protein